jgi:hypothetical protein
MVATVAAGVAVVVGAFWGWLEHVAHAACVLDVLNLFCGG